MTICHSCGQELPLDLKSVRAYFFFMHDDHTFTQVYGKTLEDIAVEHHALALADPYGSVCPVRVTVTNEGKVVERTSVGQMCYVNKGVVDLTEWFAAVSNNEIIKELAKHGFLKEESPVTHHSP